MNEITEQDLILVTGASGFIATHIVKLLLEKGYRVRGTVRSLKNEKKVAPLRNLAPNSKFEIELVEADLMNEESWLKAVQGCTYVFHTASPVPLYVPKNEDEIVRPAVNGTLYVFKACVQEGVTVKRVVLTSSLAAIAGEKFIDGYTYSEKDWPKLETLGPYCKSKMLAEKAAWDFVREREKNGLPCFELAVINPGLVMGPLLHDSDAASMELLKRLMLNKLPVIPSISLPVCDARDVAEAHFKAMVLADAKNNRHIIALKDASFIMEWAHILKEEFGPKHYRIATTKAPNFLIRFSSLFDRTIKTAVPLLDVKTHYDNTRFVSVLGVNPRDLKTSVIDAAYGFIEKKVVPKKF